MADATERRQLVVVGSSAGGIDALVRLVQTIPDGFNVPIVVAQHLDPRRESRLAEIIAPRTGLKVITVRHRVALDPGVLYLVPSDRNVEIRDHEVSVSEGGGPGSHPSVDRLLSTAARAYGEGLIAVILTGMGHDGAAGARDVQVAGGTVVIQNPETAAHPGMPLSLAPSTVDLVADVEAIGPLLGELASGSFDRARGADDKTLASFLRLVRDRTGIDFSSYKLPTVSRRLNRRMAAVGVHGLREYTEYLREHPDEYQRLAATFLIKVTEFFRDANLFDYVRETVMPRVIADARTRDNELRLWSAGCATGEEAYSLAILAAEALGDELPAFTVRIFATDLDADAVTFARRGVYSAASLDPVPQDLRARYFNRNGSEYEVKKHLRAMCVFGQHDLGQRAPFPRIDLALCRNVLIYFTPELQRRALQLFAFSLRDDGFLVLGKTESTQPLPEYFALEEARLRVYRRHGERVLIPPSRIRETSPLPMPRSGISAQAWAFEQGSTRLSREPRVTPSAERADGILLRVPFGVVTVDRNYDIVTINAAARRLLGIHGDAVGHDMLHLATTMPTNVVRAEIDAAFRGRTTRSEIELNSGEREAVSVEISCAPLPMPEDESSIQHAIVVVSDVSAVVRQRAATRAEVERLTTEAAELQRRVDRLSASNEDLLVANEELTNTNVELRSANEELLVANEEVQAATEEVETLNEELQATNEELETLNEELQATVEELNTTNDDLNARSEEIRDAARAVEQERSTSEEMRRRLEAVLVALPLPVLVLDPDGTPMLRNDVYNDVFPDGAGIDGQPDLRRRIRKAQPFHERIKVARDGTEQAWEAQGTPIAADHGSGGFVVVFREVDGTVPAGKSRRRTVDSPR